MPGSVEDVRAEAQQIQDLLGLRSPPVAVSYQATPPHDIPRVESAAPSGCTYWELAAEGRIFFTEAPDHYNCPIGAYTHNINLPPERAPELSGVLGTMFSLGYLRPQEVADVPRRREAFGAAVYAPLAQTPFEPDVVLVRGNARQVMLLTEAAAAAGVAAGAGLMGRPTCAAIPRALSSQGAVASLGCIGNRIYNGLADDELYFILPGKHVAAVAEKLVTIVHANRELEKYHQAKKAAFA
jgi:uncharacterized protein (DUF169 family)